MFDILKIAIPALLALAGTIAGLVMAQRRWRAERTAVQGTDFHRERRDAYKQLWTILEETHMKVRSAADLEKEWHPLLAQMNAFILKSDVYFEPDVHRLANAYVDALKKLRQAVEELGDEDQRFGMADSRVASWGVTRVARGIEEAGHISEELRSELKQRVQAVLKT